MKRFSPMRQASKVMITNACYGVTCSYFSEQIAEIFNSFPHYYLRVLDLSGFSFFFYFLYRWWNYNWGSISNPSCSEELSQVDFPFVWSYSRTIWCHFKGIWLMTPFINRSRFSFRIVLFFHPYGELVCCVRFKWVLHSQTILFPLPLVRWLKKSF